MQDSLFTRIINGELPSHKIYEDDRTYAFLDIHPISPGHTLVIPKKQVEFVWDLEESDYQALQASVQKIARHMRNVLSVPYVGEQIIGVDVPHAHIHLVPFHQVGEYRHVPDMSSDPDHAVLAVMAEKLALQ